MKERNHEETTSRSKISVGINGVDETEEGVNL